LYVALKRGAKLGTSLSLIGSALIVIGAIVGLIGAFIVDASPERPARTIKPTLLSMFATDFKMKFSGVTTNWSKEIDIDNGQYKAIIFYDLHYDVGSHAKFISVYLPDQRYFSDIAKHIADNAKNFFEEDQKTLPWGMKSEGQASIAYSKDIPFSGRIYIYCPGIFGVEEIGELTRFFREKGEALQVRGDEYLNQAFENMKAGRVAFPPPAEIRDNRIVPLE